MSAKPKKENLTALNMTKLTSIVQSSGDDSGGHLSVVLGHATVCLHSECIVEMRIQVTDYDSGVLQVCGTWLEPNLLTTGDTRGSVAELTHHAIGKVTAAPGHQWWTPGQLQPALC